MSDSPPELAGVSHEHLAAGETRLHVATAGSPDAPPVLLVHGWPQNWWAWRAVIPALAERHRVIAVDLPGFGWSEQPSGAYAKEWIATELLALLDSLAIPRVTWIGHDWGGWVGFLAALRAPERFERMLALAIPHPWAGITPLQAAAALGYQVPISLPLAGPRVADPLVRRILQVGRRERLSSSERDGFADHIAPHVTVAMYRTYLTREAGPALRGRYARQTLEVPTTVAVGAQDAITRGARPGPVPGQPALTVEVVSGVAHWIPEERPDVVLDWSAAG